GADAPSEWLAPKGRQRGLPAYSVGLGLRALGGRRRRDGTGRVSTAGPNRAYSRLFLAEDSSPGKISAPRPKRGACERLRPAAVLSKRMWKARAHAPPSGLGPSDAILPRQRRRAALSIRV